tara:strand:+ start:1905 stop:2150 length:246 start_codon:yes stop_codon:yes gene_type:complete
MPRYDYKCLSSDCEKSFEITHRITEDPKIKCPSCDAICKRQISRNVTFETPIDVEWEKDPSDLTETSFKKYQEAKKRKFRW